MMLQPSSPLSLPKPFGKRLETEFSSMKAEPKVEAHRKITRARYSVCAPLCASSTRTPRARAPLASYISSCTIALGMSVMLPVRSAAGSVLELLLK